MREKLADKVHESWSNWMTYLFSKCIPAIDGLVIPAGYVAHWKRQIGTSYKDLSETEKDSDRKEADKYINALFPVQHFKMFEANNSISADAVMNAFLKDNKDIEIKKMRLSTLESGKIVACILYEKRE